jgi:hypothetical protein
MPAPKTRDVFAEYYVAGLFADTGWEIYSPHRDRGFDLIVAKKVGEEMVILPVQVKGLYPTDAKTNKATYGYTGKLTALHPSMILALPFFYPDHSKPSPAFTAFMPRSEIRSSSRGFRCHPAIYRDGRPSPRRDFARFCDALRLARLEEKTGEQSAS